MIHIKDDLYLGADKYQFVLYRRFPDAKKEYTAVGYYATLTGVAERLRDNHMFKLLSTDAVQSIPALFAETEAYAQDIAKTLTAALGRAGAGMK